MSLQQNLEALEERIGYTFQDTSLLKSSLTHPSYVHQGDDPNKHNQRLEFLGDAVLSLALAEKLYLTYPNEREGFLAKARSALAKGKVLSRIGEELKLNEHLLLGDNEIRNGGLTRESTLEDALEALVGALYLDSNYETAKQRILEWYGDLKTRLDDALKTHNPKGRLQEILQPTLGNNAIQYEVIEEKGPDHDKIFLVHVIVQDEVLGRGEGPSKKQAEEDAARSALEVLSKPS